MDSNKTKTIYTGGTFDVLHVGHVNFLRQCSLLGKVVVSLNTDEFVSRYKGSPPLFSFEKRKWLLKKVPFVSRVIPNFGEENSKLTIESVKPDIIAIGTDWAKKDYYFQMGFTQDWLDENNILLVYLPYLENISTSLIKELCRK